MAESQTATFAGGCFWCTEAVFSSLRGVTRVEPGYTGGTVPDPTYEQVCTDKTGHAEAIQVTFDPSQITYRDLVEIFFATHDPTTLNRQGADSGTQYRSAVFYHNLEQKTTAESVIKKLTDEKAFPRPIVTQVAPMKQFYVAEDYHHDYYRRNQSQPYCQVVISPKLAKFRSHFQDRLK